MMDKEALLEDSHKVFLDICFGDFPFERFSEYVSPKVTGYGTNVNEQILSFKDFIDILIIQRNESASIQIDFSFTPVSRTLFAEGDAAVFIDNAVLMMTFADGKLQLDLRLTSVYEFVDGRWLAVHFHGSIPQGKEGDNDTWAVNEWKEKNELLEKQIAERTEELHQSIADLKATQTQLVHAEKMASLGELTAGIAHEIQNPLNFVNNFADVNKELLQELQDALQKDDKEDAMDIARDMALNEEKISSHGRRADGIVKAMLQHSRTSAGEKEPADINALADEFLRLAYHGLRAKDKAFNAVLHTAFDNSIGTLPMVKQDMGRVLLNIINNAFYAVQQKAHESGDEYEPEVSVSTAKQNNTLIITIADNGDGIPEKTREKIFQPFFTTKPTGQGTGLGLSLSYDIIKAHGGDISVASAAGEGTAFTITLPIA